MFTRWGICIIRRGISVMPPALECMPAIRAGGQSAIKREGVPADRSGPDDNLTELTLQGNIL